MNTANWTPYEYLKFSEEELKKLPEKTQQKIIISYYRKFIQPKHSDTILIVNPFSETVMTAKAMNSAKAAGFEPKNPDIIFIKKNKDFNGLAIELKKDIEKDVYFKTRGNGKRFKNDHVKEQNEQLNKLIKQGFNALFADYHTALKTIINYFNNV